MSLLRQTMLVAVTAVVVSVIIPSYFKPSYTHHLKYLVPWRLNSRKSEKCSVKSDSARYSNLEHLILLGQLIK